MKFYHFFWEEGFMGQFMGQNILLSAYKDTKEKNFILLEKTHESFFNISVSAENTHFDLSVHQTQWGRAWGKLPVSKSKKSWSFT